MNEALKVLKVEADPQDSRMVLYCQFGSLPVQGIKPAQMAERIRKEICDVTDTESFLKGNPGARPAPAIVEASDLSQWFFEEGLYSEAGEKHRAEYLKNLPERREKLRTLTLALEALEDSFEADVYHEGLSDLRLYLIRSGLAEEMWDHEFYRGFGE